MKEILCAMALPFIAEGDSEMLALHDQHGEASFAERHKAALAEAGAMLEEVLGVSPGQAPPGFSACRQARVRAREPRARPRASPRRA